LSGKWDGCVFSILFQLRIRDVVKLKRCKPERIGMADASAKADGQTRGEVLPLLSVGVKINVSRVPR
jgi:hypothetical protein